MAPCLNHAPGVSYSFHYSEAFQMLLLLNAQPGPGMSANIGALHPPPPKYPGGGGRGGGTHGLQGEVRSRCMRWRSHAWIPWIPPLMEGFLGGVGHFWWEAKKQCVTLGSQDVTKPSTDRAQQRLTALC